MLAGADGLKPFFASCVGVLLSMSLEISAMMTSNYNVSFNEHNINDLGRCLVRSISDP